MNAIVAIGAKDGRCDGGSVDAATDTNAGAPAHDSVAVAIVLFADSNYYGQMASIALLT